jgi:hypothetical protein
VQASDCGGKLLAAGPSADQPILDAAVLPSLESIGAQTDIRPFLRTGVPPELARAALRRAWSEDPAIRTFKGLAESDWDFNDPNGMHGFGELGPEFDVSEMVDALFGKASKSDSDVTEANASESDDRILSMSANSVEPDEGQLSNPVFSQTARETSQPPMQNGAAIPVPAFEQSSFKQPDNFSVTKNNISDEPIKQPRSHGGALPQ